MIIRTNPYQRCPEKQISPQIEWCGRLTHQHLPDARFARVRVAVLKINLGDRERPGRKNRLHEAAFLETEYGSENLVPAHELIQTPLESVAIKRAAESQRQRKVVGRVLRRKWIRNPVPLPGVPFGRKKNVLRFGFSARERSGRRDERWLGHRCRVPLCRIGRMSRRTASAVHSVTLAA